MAGDAAPDQLGETAKFPEAHRCEVRPWNGTSGQDGSYLAEFLLDKGYEVYGLIRRASSFNTDRIDHIYQDPHDPNARLSLHYRGLANREHLSNLVYNIKPDDIYHLQWTGSGP